MKINFKPSKLGYVLIAVVLLIVGFIVFRKRDKVKSFVMKSINYIKEKTWDIVSDKRISTLHPKVIGKAKEFIIRAEKELGIKLRVVSALRTWAEQTRLYAKGRTTSGKKVTNAKAGSSYHNFGLAIDVVEIKNGKALWSNPNWNKIAELGKSIGFEWGGDWKSFKDKPHFQLTFGKSLAVLRELYHAGSRAGDYVNIT